MLRALNLIGARAISGRRAHLSHSGTEPFWHATLSIPLVLQVNKKFHKFERVYRDCIKMTRDKTRIHCIPHDAPGT